MYLCLIFQNNKRMFELSSSLQIHSEIRLKWLLDDDSSWNIEKCPPAPDCSMKGCEDMVCRWDQAHKVFFYKSFMLMKRDRHILKNHPLRSKLITETMIDNLAIILGSDSSENLLFCFWDSESSKCLLNRLRNIIPCMCIFCAFCSGIITDSSEIECIKRWSPCRKS